MNGEEMKDRRSREKILVFDHEPLILEFVTTVLRKKGYRVTATVSEEEVLRLLSGDDFDLAIADLGLSRWNGQQLVRDIRRMTPDTPVVAMSAYPEKQIIRFAEQHADAFLTKPFCMMELVTAVRGAMKGPRVSDRGDREAVVGRDGALVAVGSS